MFNSSGRILLAFFMGQVAQTVMAIVAKAMYVNKPILWAGAAGFIITVAVFAGMWVVGKEVKETRNGKK